MNKILMSTAILAVVLSSCSKNEMVETLPQADSPNAIRFNTGLHASKSSENTTAGINTDGVTLTLYSSNTSFGTSGVLAFTHTGGKWVADGNPKWESVNFENVLNLMSMYDQGNVVVDPATGAASEYTIAADVASQKDLIYFGQELHTIPSGGNITAIYKHALSRVKMENVTADIQVDCKMVNLKGFDGAATPTISAANNTVTWSNNNDDAAAEDKGYEYDLENAAVVTNDMYIIPQTTATHPGSGNPVAEGVEVIFMSKVGSTPIAGWESVEAFLKANPDVPGVTLGGNVYTGVMYAKAVFPISGKQFEDGVYYNLQLNFAGSSLQYVSGKYYDENGVELEFDDDKMVTPKPEIDEPVNPDSTGDIGLNVSVTPWPAAADTDVSN